MNSNTPIFRSLKTIEEKIQEKLTVESLAEEIHFSKYHYQRLFQKVVGDSVMAYVTKRRLTLAAAELAETNHSVLEIALKYGYDSHEGFTRSFKAYMGITPAKYRKYHLSTLTLEWRKEKSTMQETVNPYSAKTIQEEMLILDDIIRELNSLTAESWETAAQTRKQKQKKKGMEAYEPFLDFAADRAEKTARQIASVLERVSSIPKQPDAISACFLVMKTLEDTACEASILAFQTNLTIARALPEHQSAFRPLCDRYKSLAEHARMKTEKIAAFFRNLSSLIFQDMRQNAQQKLQKCVEAGQSAADMLSDPALPYSYMAEGIQELTKKLFSLPLEAVTVCLLEDMIFHLETISMAAEVDTWREPAHKTLFDGISDFKAHLEEAAELFRNLPGDTQQVIKESEECTVLTQTTAKMYRDLAIQEGTLLFYLKGEIQKLGDSRLNTEQKAAFEAICHKMTEAVRLAEHWTGETDSKMVETLLQQACAEMLSESEKLGVCGGAIRYIAEEAKSPLKYLTVLS